MRNVADAGWDVAHIAMNIFRPGKRGYFTLRSEDASSPDSMDETTQQKLWVQTLAWVGITQENTALKVADE